MLVWDPSGISSLKRDEERVSRDASRLLPVGPDFYRAWYSRDGQCAVLIWGRDTTPLTSRRRVQRDESGVRLFVGWAVDLGTGAPVLDASGIPFGQADAIDGEYAVCRAQPDGEFRVWRNLMGSVPLYYSPEPDRFVLSTRASVAAYGRRLSSQFSMDRSFARSVLSGSTAMNDHSIFEGVRALQQGSVVFRPSQGRPVVQQMAPVPFSDAALAEEYQRDRTSYWDGAFERLRSLAGVFHAAQVPIEVPVSGGKDSRLLIGLLESAGLHDHIGSLVTWGRPGDPNLASAGDVAGVLGLEGRHTARELDGFVADADAQSGIPTSERFFRHAFLTEGEMSPMDLTGVLPRPGTSAHGQEGGLRNVAGDRHFGSSSELLGWFRVHLGDWDFCKILTDEARKANEDEFLEYFGQRLVLVDDLNQIPSLHRIEFRYWRWVSRTWNLLNSTSFAPFLFGSDTAVRYAFNAGARSRSLEEFHFELLRRAEPRLLGVPFAEQTWDPRLRLLPNGIEPPVSAPYTWDEERKPMARRLGRTVFRDNFAAVQKLVETRQPEVLEGVVDPVRLRNFSADGMSFGHVQPLMHLVNLLVVDAVDSFDELDCMGRSLESFELPTMDF
jgi:hypothetical protein